MLFGFICCFKNKKSVKILEKSRNLLLMESDIVHIIKTLRKLKLGDKGKNIVVGDSEDYTVMSHSLIE